MTTTDGKREPGYRGSLPPRTDHLARPWILTVIGIFVLIFVLAIAGVPSRFLPDPTPIPTAVPTASPSADASASAGASESADASASPSASTEASGSAEASPTP
jgi:hypothetical protein